MHNASGLWSVWQAAGVAIAQEDAHIQETDSTGQAGIASASLGATTHAAAPLVIAENLATVNLVSMNKASVGPPALVITAKNTAISCTSDTGPSSATIAADNGAAGVALELSNSGGAEFRGCLNLEEQGDPSAAVKGDVWKTSSTANNQRGWLSFEDDNGAVGGTAAGLLRAHASPGGLGYRYAAQGGGLTSDNTTLVSAVTLVVDPGGDQLRPGEGLYLINYAAQVKLDVGTTLTTRVEVQLLANAVIVNQFFIQFNNANQALPVTGIFEQDISPGPITFEIKFAQSNGVPTEDVICENARISAQGSYDRL
jgi:hypothetical protein